MFRIARLLALTALLCPFLACQRVKLCVQYGLATHNKVLHRNQIVVPQEIQLKSDATSPTQAFNVVYATFLLPQEADVVTTITPRGSVLIHCERFGIVMVPPCPTGRIKPDDMSLGPADRKTMEAFFTQTGPLDSFEHWTAMTRDTPQPLLKTLFMPKRELLFHLLFAIEKGSLNCHPGLDVYLAPHGRGMIFRINHEEPNPETARLTVHHWSMDQPVIQVINYKSKISGDVAPLHLLLSTLHYQPSAVTYREEKLKAVALEKLSRLKPRPGE